MSSMAHIASVTISPAIDTMANYAPDLTTVPVFVADASVMTNGRVIPANARGQMLPALLLKAKKL